MRSNKFITGILSFVFFASIVLPASASPLDALKQFLPDIAAMDLRQDRDMVYVNVCNLGGALADSEDTLIIAIQKPRGWIVSVTASTTLMDPTSCYEFPVASVNELEIRTSGLYSLNAAALLQKGRADGNKYNNRITKKVDLVFPAKSQPIVTQVITPATNYYNDINNTRLCTAANNYCADGVYSGYNGYYPQYTYTNTTMYCHNSCPPGTNNCPRIDNSSSISCDTNSQGSYQYSYNSYEYNDGFPVCDAAHNHCNNTYGNNYNKNYSSNNYNNNNVACTSANNYCNNYYNVYNYNNNTAPTRIIYPNGGETFANDSGNQFALNAYVGVNPRTVDHIVINIYRRNISSGNYEELYRTDRSTPPYNAYAGDNQFTVARTFTTSDWADGDYTAKIFAYDQWNNVLSQDSTDATFHVGVANSGRSDLVIERIYQNTSDKRIVAQICNRWRDMDRSTSIRTDFTVNNKVASSYNTIQLFHGQCMDSLTSVNPVDLNMNSNGSYYISVKVDANNNVDECDESNNSLSLSLYMETQTQKPDLVIDRIWANDQNRIMSAKICNIGWDMPDSSSWSIQIVNTGTNASAIYSGNRLMKGQCMEVNNNYASLGIYRSGGYSMRVSADMNNAISEQSEWNNIVTQYVQIWMN